MTTKQQKQQHLNIDKWLERILDILNQTIFSETNALILCCKLLFFHDSPENVRFNHHKTSWKTPSFWAPRGDVKTQKKGTCIENPRFFAEESQPSAATADLRLGPATKHSNVWSVGKGATVYDRATV